MNPLSEKQWRALLRNRPPDSDPAPHFALTRCDDSLSANRYMVTLYVRAMPGGHGYDVERCRGAATIAQAAALLEALQREMAPRLAWTHYSRNHRPRRRTFRRLPVFFDEPTLLDFISHRRGRYSSDLGRIIARVARKADLRHQFQMHRNHQSRFRGLLRARSTFGDAPARDRAPRRPHATKHTAKEVL